MSIVPLRLRPTNELCIEPTAESVYQHTKLVRGINGQNCVRHTRLCCVQGSCYHNVELYSIVIQGKLSSKSKMQESLSMYGPILYRAFSLSLCLSSFCLCSLPLCLAASALSLSLFPYALSVSHLPISVSICPPLSASLPV